MVKWNPENVSSKVKRTVTRPVTVLEICAGSIYDWPTIILLRETSVETHPDNDFLRLYVRLLHSYY